MALTEIGRLLIDCLQNFQIQERARVITFLTLKDDVQMLEMCRYLNENRDATEDQILAEAERINRENETG